MKSIVGMVLLIQKLLIKLLKIMKQNIWCKFFRLHKYEIIKEESYFENIIDVEKDFPKDVMLTQVFQPLLDTIMKSIE